MYIHIYTYIYVYIICMHNGSQYSISSYHALTEMRSFGGPEAAAMARGMIQKIWALAVLAGRWPVFKIEMRHVKNL